MCISDWRIGRLIRSVSSTQTPGIGASATLPRNPQRVGLLISAQSTLAISTHYPIISVAGVVISWMRNGDNAMMFTMQQYGDLTTRDWSVLTPTAATVLSFTEFFLPEEILAAGLEEFKRSLNLR